jgi:hypothetical protein
MRGELVGGLGGGAGQTGVGPGQLAPRYDAQGCYNNLASRLLLQLYRIT